MTNREPPRTPPDLGAFRPDEREPTHRTAGQGGPSGHGFSANVRTQVPGLQGSGLQGSGSPAPDMPRIATGAAHPHPHPPQPVPQSARPAGAGPAQRPPQNFGPGGYTPAHYADPHARHAGNTGGRGAGMGDTARSGRNARVVGYAPPPRRGRGAKIAMIVGALILVPVVGAALLITFMPIGPIQDRLIQEVKAQTGRDLVIAGKSSLSIFPRIALSVSDVSLSAPAGMGGAPTLTMASLDARVKLWPLLSKRVEVEEIVLRQPVVDLRVDAKGRKSWEQAVLDDADTVRPVGTPRTRLAAAGQASDAIAAVLAQARAPGAVPGAAPGAAPSAAPHARSTPLADLPIAALTIIDGTVRYTDERTKLRHEVTAVNATLSAPSLDAPLDGSGSVVWRGDVVRFEHRLMPFRAALEQGPAEVTLRVASARVEASYTGNAALGGELGLDGAATFRATSVRALGEWLGLGDRRTPQGASRSLRPCAHGRHVDCPHRSEDADRRSGRIGHNADQHRRSASRAQGRAERARSRSQSHCAVDPARYQRSGAARRLTQADAGCWRTGCARRSRARCRACRAPTENARAEGEGRARPRRPPRSAARRASRR